MVSTDDIMTYHVGLRRWALRILFTQLHAEACLRLSKPQTECPDGGYVDVQVGFKDMLFMQLHAEAILDLSERFCKEIQFRAVAGDFKLLQGKFLLSEPQLEVSP